MDPDAGATGPGTASADGANPVTTVRADAVSAPTTARFSNPRVIERRVTSGTPPRQTTPDGCPGAVVGVKPSR